MDTREAYVVSTQWVIDHEHLKKIRMLDEKVRRCIVLGDEGLEKMCVLLVDKHLGRDAESQST